MTELILKFVNKKEDLIALSSAYIKGDLKLNISKIARALNADGKTVKRHLNRHIPKRKRKKKSYLDDYFEIIKTAIIDPNREFDYIDHLYRFIKRKFGITCNSSTFNRYIRRSEELNYLFKKNHSDNFTIRFETEIGQLFYRTMK